MARLPLNQQTPKATEFQKLVEQMRMNQLHIANLLSIASARAEDEMETVIAAAIRYHNTDHDIWGRIQEIADEAAEGGAA
jgi:hypothetical protein